MTGPRVVLVTGAASGMGRLAAQRMADAGAAVAAFDQNPEGLEETAHGRAAIRTRKLDVADARDVESAVAEVESELGPIDRVYSAAAILPTGLLRDQDVGEIHRIMDVNFGGVVNVAKAVLPGMLERGRGDLVNFASMAGWIPLAHFGAYNASKFAVVAFTEVLHHENRGRGVRFACVCPPLVDTPLLLQARSRPRLLEQGRRIPPEAVLDATERALERGRLWVFPGFGTRTAWRMRRWLPGLFWWYDRRVEGL